jgi:hypothetical protein
MYMEFCLVRGINRRRGEERKTLRDKEEGSTLHKHM